MWTHSEACEHQRRLWQQTTLEGLFSAAMIRERQNAREAPGNVRIYAATGCIINFTTISDPTVNKLHLEGPLFTERSPTRSPLRVLLKHTGPS